MEMLNIDTLKSESFYAGGTLVEAFTVGEELIKVIKHANDYWVITSQNIEGASEEWFNAITGSRLETLLTYWSLRTVSRLYPTR